MSIFVCLLRNPISRFKASLGAPGRRALPIPFDRKGRRNVIATANEFARGIRNANRCGDGYIATRSWRAGYQTVGWQRRFLVSTRVFHGRKWAPPVDSESFRELTESRS